LRRWTKTIGDSAAGAAGAEPEESKEVGNGSMQRVTASPAGAEGASVRVGRIDPLAGSAVVGSDAGGSG
jgi:hypothetical protein